MKACSLTWVVGTEAQNDVAVRIQDESVTTHGGRRVVGRRDVRVLERAGFFLRAIERLEVMAVQVEGVAARVEVVDDDLHDLAPLKHE